VEFLQDMKLAICYFIIVILYQIHLQIIAVITLDYIQIVLLHIQNFKLYYWGSDSWIQYISSPKLASNFTNCGLQSDAASYTACINLNGNNIDPAGPNFIMLQVDQKIMK